MQESGLSFHHVGCRDRTQAVRFGSKHLYLLGSNQTSLHFLVPSLLVPFMFLTKEIPDRSNVKKDGLILAHGLRGPSTMWGGHSGKATLAKVTGV